jgi:hypothetical protein
MALLEIIEQSKLHDNEIPITNAIGQDIASKLQAKNPKLNIRYGAGCVYLLHNDKAYMLYGETIDGKWVKCF